MRNFKQFLTESQAPWQFKTKQEIETHLKSIFPRSDFEHIKINDDLSVSMNDDLVIDSYMLTKYHNLNLLPVQYKDVTELYITCRNIDSLQGLPYTCNKFYVSFKTNITSLEYAPLQIKEGGLQLHLQDNIKNAIGIGRKYLKEINGILWLPNSIESNVLGICTIKKLQSIKFLNDDFETSPSLRTVSDILNKHLHKDIDECQEELIQNGFEDYAKF